MPVDAEGGNVDLFYVLFYVSMSKCRDMNEDMNNKKEE
jgi:hypothetical protein